MSIDINSNGMQESFKPEFLRVRVWMYEHDYRRILTISNNKRATDLLPNFPFLAVCLSTDMF